ncbi:hypothetical protein BU16DRAFT_23809 [Lophium mytilinum]|uniref:Uncharacterized protein n=1 Tax=Lophium mytilinum TaxID=390894 RepID=A0A6A6RGP1_9PEZI|nr:hypothetical protein BU16DRAFT_23809 [Lophium mytilinum]
MRHSISSLLSLPSLPSLASPFSSSVTLLRDFSVSTHTTLTSLKLRMGAWGFNFLESDYDYDIAADLADEAGVEDLMFPDDPAVTVDKLNDGLLKAMFDRRQKMRPQPRYEIVMLAVLAMKLGCTIEESHIKLIKRVYRRCEEGGMGDEKVARMKQALSKYTAGQPHNFGDKGLLETMNRLGDEDTRQQNEKKGGASTEKEKEPYRDVDSDGGEQIAVQAAGKAKKPRQNDEGVALKKGTKRSHSEADTADVEDVVREPKILRYATVCSLLPII